MALKRKRDYRPNDSSSAVQPDEALYLEESQKLVEKLSLNSVMFEAFKRQAEAQNIDIERAVMNATQQPIVGAESEKESSLRKRHANYYGVMVNSRLIMLCKWDLAESF